ncbi:unnamed protein product [Lactuca saligna]|uniref:Uncharacterized protein n=1 Tax=Lactuca saligna TaxID=75948 RepID=A0AA35ZRC7_LACSI|nr:unnamed protein product [Lactuca saligna]
MGEDASHTGDKGKPLDVTPDIIVSLPPQLTPIIPTTSKTGSPTFENIVKQPITSLFSSQSIDPPTTTSLIQDSSFMETEHESEGFGGTFENLEFDEEETDFLDHNLMKMKQFKILNTQLNSIFQSQADLGGGNSVTSLEVDGLLKMLEGRISSKVLGMIKDSESRLLEKIDLCDHSNEMRVNAQKSTFEGDLKELKLVAKERHVLFVQDVKKVRENVNYKLQELRQDMKKEISNVRTEFASLNQKVDIICDAVTKFAKLYESLSPHIAQISTTENKNFMEVSTILKELKTLSSMPALSSLLSSEDLIQKFSKFEALLLQQFAPLSRISSLLPTTDAPPASTGEQEGERKIEAGGTRKCGISGNGRSVGTRVVLVHSEGRWESTGLQTGMMVSIGASYEGLFREYWCDGQHWEWPGLQFQQKICS